MLLGKHFRTRGSWDLRASLPRSIIENLSARKYHSTNEFLYDLEFLSHFPKRARHNQLLKYGVSCQNNLHGRKSSLDLKKFKLRGSSLPPLTGVEGLDSTSELRDPRRGKRIHFTRLPEPREWANLPSPPRGSPFSAPTSPHSPLNQTYPWMRRRCAEPIWVSYRWTTASSRRQRPLVWSGDWGPWWWLRASGPGDVRIWAQELAGPDAQLLATAPAAAGLGLIGSAEAPRIRSDFLCFAQCLLSPLHAFHIPEGLPHLPPLRAPALWNATGRLPGRVRDMDK